MKVAKFMLKIKLCICLMLVIAPYSVQAIAKCENLAAKLLSAEGIVEKQSQNQSIWQPVSQHEFLCQGDKIRTSGHSRVALKFILEPQAIIELEQNSALTLPKIEKKSILTFNLPESANLLLSKAIKTFKRVLLL